MICKGLTARIVSPKLPQIRKQRSRARIYAFNNSLDCTEIAEGPGSGHRRTPPQLGQHLDMQHHRPSDHSQRSTLDCYKAFPLQARASCPLPRALPDSRPAGMEALTTEDAGPVTGRRRPPSPVEGRSQVVPFPATSSSSRGHLQTELMVRHHPDEVLKKLLERL